MLAFPLETSRVVQPRRNYRYWQIHGAASILYSKIYERVKTIELHGAWKIASSFIEETFLIEKEIKIEDGKIHEAMLIAFVIWREITKILDSKEQV